ncbi:MAG: prepilin-type N-terminal cleavage/methylation domain-containing protein [Bacillaceae bacterium]|nr:prepilin-type N-terminal cleavage/methylation domain-containing protein [Bacillaceae bacterium]
MRQLRKRISGNENGFTLIELLVVFAILGLLAMIIVPRITTSLDTTRVTTDEANTKLLQSAVERYYFDHGSYPTSDGTDGSATTGGIEILTDTLVNEAYIDEAPEDPWDQGRAYKLKDGVVQKLGTP